MNDNTVVNEFKFYKSCMGTQKQLDADRVSIYLKSNHTPTCDEVMETWVAQPDYEKNQNKGLDFVWLDSVVDVNEVPTGATVVELDQLEITDGPRSMTDFISEMGFSYGITTKAKDRNLGIDVECSNYGDSEDAPLLYMDDIGGIFPENRSVVAVINDDKALQSAILEELEPYMDSVSNYAAEYLEENLNYDVNELSKYSLSELAEEFERNNLSRDMFDLSYLCGEKTFDMSEIRALVKEMN